MYNAGSKKEGGSWHQRKNKRIIRAGSFQSREFEKSALVFRRKIRYEIVADMQDSESWLDYDFKPEGKKIVVIGGGMTGSETAEHFAMMDYHINSMAVFYCHTKSRLVKDLQAWVVIYY